MTLPSGYYLRERNGEFAVWHDHFGELEDGIECRARAEDFAHDHAEQAAAAAQYDLPEDLASAVADFLLDLDRHNLGRHMMIGLAEDRCEIASLRSLRKAHAAATARAA